MRLEKHKLPSHFFLHQGMEDAVEKLKLCRILENQPAHKFSVEAAAWGEDFRPKSFYHPFEAYCARLHNLPAYVVCFHKLRSQIHKDLCNCGLARGNSPCEAEDHDPSPPWQLGQKKLPLPTTTIL